MRKIQVNFVHGECMERGCPFRFACACHHTAGDFRLESGFTPQIFVDTETKELFCKTMDSPPYHFCYSILPADVDDLGNGYVNITKALYEAGITFNTSHG
jgi:hypothetical protein